MQSIYLHCIQQNFANMTKSEDLRGCVQTTNGAKKVRTKSSSIYPKNGAIKLSSKVLKTANYGAKKDPKMIHFGAKRGSFSPPVERLGQSQIFRLAHKL